ncbi:MAG: hypothetical protein N2202_01340 [Proteobacteria bacterium]|nr:hypothetical protein [Pseudomonadota bacterium]
MSKSAINLLTEEKRFVFLILFLFLFIPKNLIAEKVEILTKAYLILPEQSNIKINWILAPLNEKIEQKVSNIQFIVDKKNNPLILFDKRIIQNPITGGLFKTNKPVKKFLLWEQDSLVFLEEENLSYGELTKKNTAVPLLNIKPIIKLPGRNFDIHIGDKNSLYGSGYNEKRGIYEVYIFNREQKVFEKITEVNEKINSITGLNKKIYIAHGKRISEYNGSNLNFYYEHPREEIIELLFSQDVGLIYKTKHGVGYIKDGYAIEFLQIEEPEIYLKNNSLYVLLTKNFGIFELKNIDDLKRFNYKIDKILKIERNF